MGQRTKQTASLQERLTADLRAQTYKAIRTERTDLLKRAMLAETASNINEWTCSPGLQPPE